MPPIYPNQAFVALGANTGCRARQMRTALEALAEAEGVQVARASPVYESEAHTLAHEETQPSFLNAVAEVRTTLAPEALLGVCQQIEAEAGRDRTARRWSPRPLDLDLIVFERETRATVRLTLPHPRMGERRFVLRPLCDLAPNLYVPAPFDATASALLQRCADPAALRRTPRLL